MLSTISCFGSFILCYVYIIKVFLTWVNVRLSFLLVWPWCFGWFKCAYACLGYDRGVSWPVDLLCVGDDG